VGVVLFNHGVDGLPVKVGDRIAQIIITKITETEVLQMKELPPSMQGKSNSQRPGG
jgi:dUTPase